MAHAVAAPLRTRLSWSRAARLGLLVVPVLFAEPILLGLLHSIFDLVGEPNPYFGDISGSAADARALDLGSPLYQNPDVGYTPLIYTPLMSVLMAGLDQLYRWDGWAMALTLLADIALVGLAARLAWGATTETSRPERIAALVGAVGMGALTIWIMAFVPFNFVYTPRPDQLSWAFALLGLALVPAAAEGSRRAQLGSILLLSAGFWTKQTASPALVTAGIWVMLAAMRGRVRPRTAVVFSAALLGVNVLGFGLLTLFTDGWAWRFIVEFPEQRASLISVTHSINDLLESVSPPLVFAGVGWAAAVLARRDGVPWPQRHVAIASILALFIVVDIPAAVWFRQAQGAVHNMYVGIAWSCGLLLAAAWGIARHRPMPLAVVAGMVAFLFGVSESEIVKDRAYRKLHLHPPPKSLHAFVGQQPPALLQYARHHLVYHPAYPGIGARRETDFYPGSDNIETLLWSGVQPRYLIRALLDRRFDLVYLFENDSNRGDNDGYGRWEENYFWKLNQVVLAKYRPATGSLRRLEEAGLVYLPVAGFFDPFPFERRPGPDPAPWMSRCFGPFKVPGAKWRIAHGGGFWCRTRPGSSTMRLVDTPAGMSEIRDDHFTARGPALAIRATYGGYVRVKLGSWKVQRYLFPRERIVVALPRGRSGALSILASRGSGAEVRLLPR